MIFWIVLVLAVLFTIAAILFDKYAELEAGFFISTLSAGILDVVAFIMLVCIIIDHAGLDGQVASMKTRYNTITYQLENDIYDNDNDIGKRELMEDVREWNEDIVKGQTNQKDPWIGIFVPNIYDQFEVIELKEK